MPSVDPELDAQPVVRKGNGRKIVALIPAGEVHDKTSIRAWSHADPKRDVKAHYNAGDMFVYEASLRLLDFDQMEAIPLQSDWDQRTVDRLNEEAAFCFVRGSNYIHHEMKWGNLPASYHNNAANLSFADGHAETHRWVAGSTVVPAVKGALPTGTPALPVTDWEWLKERSGSRKNAP